MYDFVRVKSNVSPRPSTLTYPREIFDRTTALTAQPPRHIRSQDHLVCLTGSSVLGTRVLQTVPNKKVEKIVNIDQTRRNTSEKTTDILENWANTFFDQKRDFSDYIFPKPDLGTCLIQSLSWCQKCGREIIKIEVFLIFRYKIFLPVSNIP